jgi:hypothetical protein
MAKKIDATEHQAKFDAVLRRRATMKPLSKKELSARIQAEKAAKRVQKNGQEALGASVGYVGVAGKKHMFPPSLYISPASLHAYVICEIGWAWVTSLAPYQI